MMRDIVWRRAAGYLFDLDGTLVDSSSLHERAFQEALGESGEFRSTSFCYAELRGLSTPDVFASLGFSESLVAELTRIKRRHYKRMVAQGDLCVFPGARELLHDLRLHNSRIAIVTSASYDGATASIASAGLQGLCDVLVTADDVRNAKPHPEPYRRASEDLAVPIRECVAIEDAPSGVLSARAAGAFVVGVADEGLQPLVDAYFSSIAEFRETVFGAGGYLE